MKNKFVSLLISVGIAFALWLYVITAVSPGSQETYRNIPVVLEGESVLSERGMMITGISSDTVTLVLSGNRTDLSKVNSSNITVKADLSKIYEPGHQIPLNFSSITYPGNVASNAFVVETKTPERITINVERRISKDVPVEVMWIGAAPEGFMSDRENRVLDYPYVNVTGPQSVVDKIEKAVIEVDLVEKRESISENYLYTLCDGEGQPVDAELIVTNVEEIHLDVSIQRVKDLTLAYQIVEGGGARENNAIVSLSPATIRVSGSEAALENLGDQLVIGVVNLAEITSNTSMTFPINLPEGIKNLTGVTQVEAEISLNGLSAKEFVVEKIVTQNVPEGMQADIITEKLTVVVRGPAAQIAKLTVDDVTIVVDFEGAQIGTSTFRAAIRLADEFSGVGLLRVDSVSATLSVPEAEEEG